MSSGRNNKRLFEQCEMAQSDGNSSGNDEMTRPKKKPKCTWCERPRERNDLCNRCRQKVESRAKKLLEQKISGDNRLMSECVQDLRRLLPLQLMNGEDVIEALDQIFPILMLFKSTKKMYKGKKGNKCWSLPDRALRIQCSEVTPCNTVDLSSMSRDDIVELLNNRTNALFASISKQMKLKRSNGGYSNQTTYDSGNIQHDFVAHSGDDSEMVTVSPPFTNNLTDEIQQISKMVSISSWGTAEIEAFLQSCGLNQNSIRSSGILQLTGSQFCYCGQQELITKYRFSEHVSDIIIQQRAFVFWCCSAIEQLNMNTVPKGFCRFPTPLAFNQQSSTKLVERLHGYGLTLVSISKNTDPNSVSVSSTGNLRFCFDIIAVYSVNPDTVLQNVAKFVSDHSKQQLVSWERYMPCYNNTISPLENYSGVDIFSMPVPNSSAIAQTSNVIANTDTLSNDMSMPITMPIPDFNFNTASFDNLNGALSLEDKQQCLSGANFGSYQDNSSPVMSDCSFAASPLLSSSTISSQTPNINYFIPPDVPCINNSYSNNNNMNNNNNGVGNLTAFGGFPPVGVITQSSWGN